MLRVDPVDG